MKPKPSLYTYNAKLVRAKDGDSVVLLLDYGMYQSGQWDFRIEGVDTPEIFGRACEAEKSLGRLAKVFVEATLEKQGDSFRVQTLKKSKYDYLVRIYVDVDCNGEPLDENHRIWKILDEGDTDQPPLRWHLTLTDLLIAFGHGLRYSGEKKRPWEVRRALLEEARVKWVSGP